MDQQSSYYKVLVSKVLFFAFLGCILLFSLSPSIALTLGLFIGLLFTNPFIKPSRFATKYLLQLSIIGLGFGMRFDQVMAEGKENFMFTVITICAAMGMGYLLGRLF